MADSGENADDTSASSCENASDPPPLTVEQLKERIAQLEQEQQDLEKKFGCQRAKYRELYDKKEEELKDVLAHNQELEKELEDMRNELVALNLDRQGILSEKNKHEAEFASLKKFLIDTLEENSQMVSKCTRLEAELERRGAALEDKERSSDPLPIHKITQATKSLARKVMEFGADSSTNLAKESLEDEARKAQEDAEALRALLIPLEDQIKNLKEKLRDAYDRLQKYEKQEGRSFDGVNMESPLAKSPIQEQEIDGASGEPAAISSAIPKSAVQEPLIQLSPTSPIEPAAAGSVPDTKASIQENKDLEAFLGSGDVSTLTSAEEAVSMCEKCRVWEDLLNSTQQQLSEVQKALENSEKAFQRVREDLNRERTSRQEMESKWNGIKDQYDEQVSSLKERLSDCESALRKIQQKHLQVIKETENELGELQQVNVKLREEIEAVQARNDKILGKHYIRSSELQAKDIDLPNTVPELHEMLLRQREELIDAKTAAEMHEDEAKAFGTQLQELKYVSERKIKDMAEREERYKSQLIKLKKQLDDSTEMIIKLEEKEKKSCSEVQELERRVHMETINKAKLEKEIKDYQQKISSLQKSLTDTEIVQKDFVCLSQRLQTQLEILRTEGTEVRWEHDEDVDKCPTCKNTLRNSRDKTHCRHCGKIFCHDCLKFTVNSGPRCRPSRVCQVCHTLLKPDTAPYFCKDPPSAPD